MCRAEGARPRAVPSVRQLEAPHGGEPYAGAAADYEHEHGIAEGVEPVALRDRESVELARLLDPCEGHHEREKRRCAADGSWSAAHQPDGSRTPASRRVSVRPASSPVRATVSSTRTLVVPRRAHAPQPGFASRAEPEPDSALRVGRAPRASPQSAAERVETDVQRHPLRLRAASRSSRREMETGSRRRRRSRLVRVHRLISAGVAERLVDVGRQRYLAPRHRLEAHLPAPPPSGATSSTA